VDVPAEIRDGVWRIIAENRNVSPNAISADTKLESELSIDSLAMIEINVALEETFDFRAPDVATPDELGIVTVGDLVEFVAGQLDRAGQARA
jgi:acyl carrier protein